MNSTTVSISINVCVLEGAEFRRWRYLLLELLEQSKEYEANKKPDHECVQWGALIVVDPTSGYPLVVEG